MIFRRALVGLTVSFAVVQLVLFGAFALGVYAYVTTAFDFDAAGGEGDLGTPEASFETLRVGLLLAYGALVLIVPLTSYALAAIALRPVRAGFEQQQRFVDDASHEFRTPLSIIQAQLELAMGRRRTVAEYRASIGGALVAVGRLDRMIDELLLLTRQDRRAVVATTPIDLVEVALDAVAQLPQDRRDRVRFDHSAPVPAVGSAAMLGRAVLNLVTNALRYSAGDTPVVVTVEARGRVARIAVKDSGVGMTRRERRHAFDRFWRADTSRSIEGSGLGLSIVREIALVHGGTVRLESSPGAGTTASIELPLSR